MEEERAKKRPLDLDWEKLLPSQDDEPQPLLIVEATTQVTGTDTEPSKKSAMGSDHEHSQRDEGLELIKDNDLNDSIRKKKQTLESMAHKLPDKGQKLRATLKRLEDELEHRKFRRLHKEADGCEKPTQSTSLSNIGVPNDFRQETTSSQACSQSSFASSFCRKMGEDTDGGAVNAFDKELSVLGRCDRRKMRHNGELSQRGRQRGRPSSRQLPFQRSRNISKNVLSNGNKNRRASPTYSVVQIEENLTSCVDIQKDALQVLHINESRPTKKQTIVLVDEDESQIQEMTEQEDKLPECMKDVKITYPSRDDPESIEICYKDIDCLAPDGHLTSPIMNFYIRYLQQQASPTNTCDYHFFNTYFYKKLKEAVSYKGNDKYASFVKFRRWWKGVNIFQKAYVLIPIHEDHHWSLVIICIPDKDDESWPIILHLDSLRLHSSGSIFYNIKSYLKEEWNYLSQEVAPSDLPIADRIWKHLPRRIDEKVITVPQQKNDSDCGLFVLFFMERFIEEAPERLKKKDLAMFGKQWFKPEEASSLRVKLRKILKEEFRKECEMRLTVFG